MSIYDMLIDTLDGKKFESIEDYDDTVHCYISDLEEELGKAERWALTHDPVVFSQLGVEIKDVYPEEEDY